MPAWFAIVVKSKHEKLTARLLREKGYEEFLPIYRARRKWSGRTKEVDLPLFPGYIFCRVDWDIKSRVLTTPGVVRIVGFNNTPTAVPDEEIEAIRVTLASDRHVMPWPAPQAGDYVRIEGGPLKGVHGIVERVNQHRYLVVSVTLLQRSVAVSIDPDSVTTLAAN